MLVDPPLRLLVAMVLVLLGTGAPEEGMAWLGRVLVRLSHERAQKICPTTPSRALNPTLKPILIRPSSKYRERWEDEPR